LRHLKKLDQPSLVSLLLAAQDLLKGSEFDPDSLQITLNKLLEETGQKPGILFSLVRLAVSWAPFSPALNETLAVLGREESLLRIEKAIETASTS
jgi:glutamyl/glutaminyl-tRNA synthetase